MLLQSLGALALTLTTVCAQSRDISPLFFLSSTKHLQTTTSDDLSNGPVSAVHHELWSALSSCPTKHYAVVVQPGVTSSDFETVWLPVGAGVRTALIANDIRGHVDVTAVVNTILMDCLHHGITRVEGLTTKELRVPRLEQNVIDESVIYAVMPEVEEKSQNTRDQQIDQNDRFVEEFIGQYWNNKDYTLIYITEAQVDGKHKQTVKSIDLGLGVEVPISLGVEN